MQTDAHIDRDPVRARDDAALALALARAEREGLLGVLRTLPPATFDRIAAVLGWGAGPTRAALRALAACGRVRYDGQLCTWSVADGVNEGVAFAGAAEVLPDLARALDGGVHGRAAILDEAPVAVLEREILPASPDLRGALERGGPVIGMGGSEGALRWLASRYPRIEPLRSDAPSPPCDAELVLQLAPLGLPESPEAWFRAVARALRGGGHYILRALRYPLAPPEPVDSGGRGWWHALALAAALEGGDGRAWSEPLARCAALATGFGLPAAFDWAADPACLHLVTKKGVVPSGTRPR